MIKYELFCAVGDKLVAKKEIREKLLMYVPVTKCVWDTTNSLNKVNKHDVCIVKDIIEYGIGIFQIDLVSLNGFEFILINSQMSEFFNSVDESIKIIRERKLENILK
jgi:hypothetical protein